MRSSNPCHGSLGKISRDNEGTLFTSEDDGYASRFWFETKENAQTWLNAYVKSYAFMMGESYLEKRPEDAVEVVRYEYTVKVCYDLAQMRLNDIAAGV